MSGLERFLASWWLALVGGCLMLMAELQFGLVNWFKRDANAAAWVQAVGSILAIIATVSVVQLQHRNERRLERDRQRRADADRLEAPLSVIRTALEAVQMPAAELWCRTAAETYFVNEWPGSRFNYVEQVLGSYPYSTIPYGLLQIEFLAASRAFVASYNLINQMSDTQTKVDASFSAASQSLKHHASVIEGAVLAFEAQKKIALTAL